MNQKKWFMKKKKENNLSGNKLLCLFSFGHFFFVLYLCSGQYMNFPVDIWTFRRKLKFFEELELKADEGSSMEEMGLVSFLIL